MDTAQTTIQNPYSGIASKWNNATKNWKRDAAKEATIKGAEFDADLSLLDYQNEYNSPANKAERMREAGLNPDLLGVDGVSDSSSLSGITGSMSTPMSSQDRAGFVLDNIQGVLGMAMQMTDSYESLKARQLQNDSMAIDNQLKVEDFVRSHFNDQFNENGYSYNPNGVNNDFLKNLPRRYRKMSASAFGDIIDSRSAHSADYKGRNEMISFREDYAKGIANPYYRSSDSEFADSLRDLLKLRDDAERSSLRADKAEDDYGADYYSALDGAHMARNDARLSDNSVSASDDKLVESSVDRSINKFVDKMINSDSTFDNFVGFVISWLVRGGIGDAIDSYTKLRPRGKRK